MDDPVKKMKGIRGTKRDTLMVAGIMTVGDMKGKSNEELITLPPLLKGLSLAGLTELRDHHRIWVHAIMLSWIIE